MESRSLKAIREERGSSHEGYQLIDIKGFLGLENHSKGGQKSLNAKSGVTFR